MSIALAIDQALAKIPAPAALHISLFLAYVTLTIGLAGYAISLIRRGDIERAFIVAVALIILYAMITTGHDTVHHVMRIEALARQWRQHDFSPLIANYAAGEVSPVFLYYSVVPYLPPVALALFGVSPQIALQITLVALFASFAGTVSLLIRRLAPPERRQTAFVAGILFVTANYVFGEWVVRAALGEICCYALIPLAIIYLRRREDFARLALVFALQASSHPLVFIYGVAGAFLAAYLLYERDFFDLAKSTFAASLLALAVTSPFWAPQTWFIGDALGVKGIPATFANSFLSPATLMNPMSLVTIGPAFIAASAMIFALALRARQAKLSVGLAALFLMLIMQTTLFRGVLSGVAVLDQTQFIWRLMFPAAVIAFAAILAFTIRGENQHAKLLAGFAALSVSLMALKLGAGVGRSVGDVRGIFDATRPNIDTYFVNFPSDNLRAWGVRPFSPDYSRLAELCPAKENGVYAEISFESLRSRVPIEATYVGVPAAPFGFVRYFAAATEIAPRHCGTTLVLGPLEHGVSVDESLLAKIQYARAVSLAAMALMALVVFSPKPRRDP